MESKDININVYIISFVLNAGIDTLLRPGLR